MTSTNCVKIKYEQLTFDIEYYQDTCNLHDISLTSISGYGQSFGRVPTTADFLIEVVNKLAGEPAFNRYALVHPVLISPSMSGGYSIPLIVQEVQQQTKFLSAFIPVAPVATAQLTEDIAKNVTVTFCISS